MMGTRSGFGVSSDKGCVVECDVGLALTMQQQQQQQQQNQRKMIDTNNNSRHHHHLHNQMLQSGGGGNNTAFGVPIYANNANNNHVVASVSDFLQQQQHFGGSEPFPLSSSVVAAGGMNVKVPFTASQWQELERQTMIYKYMMASVPVPSELLIPMTKNCPNIATSNSTRYVKGSSLELGFGSSNSDPEPWRCRRTDGKKWRCSRDVAPDQKYCERHSHKSRPRSRKPVEVNTATQNLNNQTASISSQGHKSTLQLNEDHPSLFPSVSQCPSWYMRGEPNANTVASANQEWQQQQQQQHMMTRSNLGLKRDYLTSCNTNLGSSVRQQNIGGLEQHPLGFEYGHGQRVQTQSLSDQCSLLLGNLNTNQGQETRHFIDAWSTAEKDNNNKCSSLSLSMSGEANQDEENSHVGDSRPHWMSSPVSWLDSTPGGPLAEALCLGISSNANVASNASSPYGCNTSTSSSKSSSGDGRGGLNLIN